MKLVIKFPTRSRPHKFKPLLDKYIDFLSGKHDIRFVITMDDDDETMNNDDIKSFIENHKSNGIDIVYHYGQSKTKIEACNANLDGESGDVLLLISDDMVPVTRNYDDIIYQNYQEVFPDYSGAIKFNDGLRGDNLMTLPCLGWKLYESFGYVYHPDYESLYCDNEQTQACAMIGKLAVSGICIIQHQWMSSEDERADELHKRNESFYDRDHKVFEERMSRKFETDVLEEKLREKLLHTI